MAPSTISFDVKFIPAGTGSAVWDDPDASHLIARFMPAEQGHRPLIAILSLGGVRPSTNVLRDTIVSIGEDARAGRYGNFSLIVSSEDEATRMIVNDVASARNLPLYITSSPSDLKHAQPAGDLTLRDKEILQVVLNAGGTVTAAELATQLGIEQTTAGNRLVALNKKGYLQRVERAHPVGDQFVDPRSLQLNAPS